MGIYSLNGSKSLTMVSISVAIWHANSVNGTLAQIQYNAI